MPSAIQSAAWKISSPIPSVLTRQNCSGRIKELWPCHCLCTVSQIATEPDWTWLFPDTYMIHLWLIYDTSMIDIWYTYMIYIYNILYTYDTIFEHQTWSFHHFSTDGPGLDPSRPPAHRTSHDHIRKGQPVCDVWNVEMIGLYIMLISWAVEIC